MRCRELAQPLRKLYQGYRQIRRGRGGDARVALRWLQNPHSLLKILHLLNHLANRVWISRSGVLRIAQATE